MALPRFFAKETEQKVEENESLYWDSYGDITNEDTVYLLTWNPKPRFYSFDKHGDNDYNLQWLTMVEKLIRSIRCLSKYAFVAEISDAGKLHMHGFFVAKDPVKLHKSFLPGLRNTGYIKLNPVRKLQRKTMNYHVKDLHNTLSHFPNSTTPIVLCDRSLQILHNEIGLIKAFALAPDLPKKTIRKLDVFSMFTKAGLKIEDCDSDDSYSL